MINGKPSKAERDRRKEVWMRHSGVGQKPSDEEDMPESLDGWKVEDGIVVSELLGYVGDRDSPDFASKDDYPDAVIGERLEAND